MQECGWASGARWIQGCGCSRKWGPLKIQSPSWTGWKSLPGICFKMQYSWAWTLFYFWFLVLTFSTSHWPLENSVMNSSVSLLCFSGHICFTFYVLCTCVLSIKKRTIIPIPKSQGRTPMGLPIGPVIDHLDQSSVTLCEHDCLCCKAVDGERV